MSFLLSRMPCKNWLNAEWQKEIEQIDNCINCRACERLCPYSLETPELLKNCWQTTGHIFNLLFFYVFNRRRGVLLDSSIKSLFLYLKHYA
ncbi:hypothetical protein EXM22_09985 [Oceanispirochaeta crateris]|uniref:4Fe-4S ferredoxin-type domain-containing protein n=1 Tax=Oceanispirochaeta crateris TaxID=2518645 RepID=A0A5C1QQ94_9SPIO|nr:hypothetical protein EXM22_09985 [Oceanispirochaeta crateris]